jgi:hypothetical protein
MWKVLLFWLVKEKSALKKKQEECRECEGKVAGMEIVEGKGMAVMVVVVMVMELNLVFLGKESRVLAEAEMG